MVTMIILQSLAVATILILMDILIVGTILEISERIKRRQKWQNLKNIKK